jgi:hypothetical protein
VDFLDELTMHVSPLNVLDVFPVRVLTAANKSGEDLTTANKSEEDSKDSASTTSLQNR